MFKKPNKAAIAEAAQKNPSEMLVTEKYIAVAMPDNKVLIIHGNFKGVTVEDANVRLQNVLTKLGA